MSGSILTSRRGSVPGSGTVETFAAVDSGDNSSRYIPSWMNSPGQNTPSRIGTATPISPVPRGSPLVSPEMAPHSAAQDSPERPQSPPPTYDVSMRDERAPLYHTAWTDEANATVDSRRQESRGLAPVPQVLGFHGVAPARQPGVRQTRDEPHQPVQLPRVPVREEARNPIRYVEEPLHHQQNNSARIHWAPHRHAPVNVGGFVPIRRTRRVYFKFPSALYTTLYLGSVTAVFAGGAVVFYLASQLYPENRTMWISGIVMLCAGAWALGLGLFFVCYWP